MGGFCAHNFFAIKVSGSGEGETLHLPLGHSKEQEKDGLVGPCMTGKTSLSRKLLF